MEAALQRLRATTTEEIGAGGPTPIASALRALRRAEPDAGRGAWETTRVDVVEALASWLDLQGSMALAAYLEQPSECADPSARIAGDRRHRGDAGDPREDELGADARVDPDRDQRDATGDEARALLGWVEMRIDRVATAVARRISELPTSRSAIMGPERLVEELERRGLTTTRRARDVAALAREVTDAHVLAVRGLIERIRGEVRALRAELGPRLASLGPRAARLEALDALVGRARAAATFRLLGRIPGGLVDVFAAGLAELGRGSDEDIADAVQAAYAPGGFVADHYARSGRLVTALLEHERTALIECVTAAASLAEGRAAPP